MAHSGSRVALVVSAFVAVVEQRRGTGCADPEAIAGLAPVAHGRIVAGMADRRRDVSYAERGVAAVDGARVAVVEGGQRPGHARPLCIAGLGAVADIVVRAGSSGRKRRVGHASGRVAGIRGAGVAVLEIAGWPADASALGVALALDATITRGARAAGGAQLMLHPGLGRAAVYGARIPVVDHGRAPRDAAPAAVAGLDPVARVVVGAGAAG